MLPRAILFDMDGVLVRSEEIWLRLLEEAVVVAEEVVRLPGRARGLHPRGDAADPDVDRHGDLFGHQTGDGPVRREDLRAHQGRNGPQQGRDPEPPSQHERPRKQPLRITYAPP